MEELDDQTREALLGALQDGAAGELGELVDIDASWAESAELDGASIEMRRTRSGLALHVGPHTFALEAGSHAPTWWQSVDRQRYVDALGGVLSSALVAPSIAQAVRTGDVAGLPLPEVSRSRGTQLACLYRAHARRGAGAGRARAGFLDRCVADLYGLPLSLLMAFERCVDSTTPG